MEQKYVSVRGVNLAYSRSGSGTPLVLVHGYPLDNSIWSEVIRLLDHGFDIILPDSRGFGGSSGADSPYTMMDLADDIAGLLDLIGVKKTVIAGHSMGGYTSLAFAKKYPERIMGLGLISSQSLPDTAERKLGRYQEAQDIDKNGIQSVVEGMTPKLSSVGRVQDIVRAVMKRQNHQGLSAALRAMAGREDSTGFLKTLGVPIVIIHGGADGLIPIDRARNLGSLLPQALFVELDAVGHMPMLEVPVDTANALRFLR